MATMTKDLQAALKKAGLDASEVAQVEVGGVTNQKRLDSMLARARNTPDTAKSVADQLSVSAGVANLILDHWPAAIPTAAAQPAAATPAPATSAPPTVVGADAGVLERLFTRLLPPETIHEALVLLSSNPRDPKAQGHWRKFAGNATLLHEAKPGVVGLELSQQACTIFEESDFQHAPDELDGKTLYSLDQFLKKTVLVCVLTGDRLVQGRGLKTRVSYRPLGLKTDSIEAAQANMGVRMVAFGAYNNRLHKGDVDSAKNILSELGRALRGLQLTWKDEVQRSEVLASIKDAVDGTTSPNWTEIMREIDLDQRNGGVKMTAALAGLVGTVSPSGGRAPNAPTNPLSNLVEGLSGGRSSVSDPLRTSSSTRGQQW